MKSWWIAIGVLPAVVTHGGPVEQAIVAAMRLADEPSYSWVTMVNDDARTYDLEGRSQRGGYTWMRFPKIKSVSLRLGREHDNEIEAVFNGPMRSVIRTEQGWKTLEELPRARRDWDDDPFFWPATPSTPVALSTRGNHVNRGGGGFGSGALDPLDPAAIPWPMPSLATDGERRPYSNAQFALSQPHEELAIIVSSYVDFDVKGEVVGGTLSDLGARLLLVRAGQEDRIQPLCGAGTFRLLVRNGLVTKYIVRLEGIVLVDKRKVHIHQTAITTIRDIGQAGFAVTDEIRRKLGG